MLEDALRMGIVKYEARKWWNPRRYTRGKFYCKRVKLLGFYRRNHGKRKVFSCWNTKKRSCEQDKSFY
jgi:hypothetical protein